MRLTCTFLVVASFVPTALAADLTTLDGRKLSGEIVSIAGNDLTFKPTTGGEEKFLVTTIGAITTGPPPKGLESGKKYTLVELMDGSTFRCQAIAVKGKLLEMKLLGTSPRTISVLYRDDDGRGTVFSVNREVGDLKLEQDFRGIMRERRKAKDVWIKKDKIKDANGADVERLDSVAGTFGDGDDSASTIKFIIDGQSEVTVLRMNVVAGLILNQKLPEKAPPPALCKVIDADGNELIAASVVRLPKGYTVTTVAGMKIDLDDKQVSKFDFAAGSVKYLSDLEPVALDESGTDPEHYQKDKNLDKQPIHLVTDPATGRADVFPKGLTLKAKTVLTYELKSAYKTFRALAGVDADKQNEAPSQVKITIDDGMAVLWSGVVKKGEKPKDLNLSVQNVDRLKITVESDGSVTDLGNQVSLANARVLK
jgi:NPCBM/NEW2 domain